MKKQYKYILIAINILIFLTIAILLKTNNIANFDNTVYKIITHYKNDYLTLFFKAITLLCNSYFIICFTIILLLTIKKNKLGLKITINIVICVLINQLMKHIFRRARPVNINLIKEKGFSFPSGHAMASLSFYGFFIYLINNNKYNKKTKIISSILLSTLILLIGISRIYLGVHYASDVLAGFALSLAHLITYSLYYKKIG